MTETTKNELVRILNCQIEMDDNVEDRNKRKELIDVVNTEYNKSYNIDYNDFLIIKKFTSNYGGETNYGILLVPVDSSVKFSRGFGQNIEKRDETLVAMTKLLETITI